MGIPYACFIHIGNTAFAVSSMADMSTVHTIKTGKLTDGVLLTMQVALRPQWSRRRSDPRRLPAPHDSHPSAPGRSSLLAQLVRRGLQLDQLAPQRLEP